MDNYTGYEIAIIGMSGKFPGASNIREFWDNLSNGIETISFFTKEELRNESIDMELLDNNNYIRAKGYLQSCEYFDNNFFGISARMAETMDPQLRLLLMGVWEALEDAAYIPGDEDLNLGVFMSAASSTYWEAQAYLSDKMNLFGKFELDQLTNKDYISTRLSNMLGLTGPSLTVHTACSSSLTAIHLACQSLLGGECAMAVAGGASISYPLKKGYLFHEGMHGSSDGHCRAFDAQADGTVFGNGVGVLVLKPLSDAINDKDNIYAVIKGSALNNDGNRKVGYSAPSAIGQAEVIKLAQAISQVEAASVSYIETHGTGTKLGDPIEFEGLKAAFNDMENASCAIGSVKTNIGHLDVAAGVAGVIKTALSLKNKQLPPSLNYVSPNPQIDFQNSPFYVNTELRDWNSAPKPLRAGVSSFGIGGTNVHAILEEAPSVDSGGASKEYYLCCLSAKNRGSLLAKINGLKTFLNNTPDIHIADIAYTYQIGRKHFPFRTAIASSNTDELVEKLNNYSDTFLSSTLDRPSIFFMFPGQGSQYVDMAVGLYENEPFFRNILDACFSILGDFSEVGLKKDILFAKDGEPNELINQTEYAQPVLFCIEYSLSVLLMNWGIVPDAMIGHSIGEYVAACLAGVFSLQDAIYLVYHRGRLMQQTEKGSMFSIATGEDKIVDLLNDDISVAAYNCKSNIVVSCREYCVDSFMSELGHRNIEYIRLKTSHSFHSVTIEPIMKDFEALLTNIKFNPPKIPYISNVTGDWITFKEIEDHSYWSNQMRKPVRFMQGIEKMKNPQHIFIEAGPGTSLFNLTKSVLGQHSHAINLLKHPKDTTHDYDYFLNKIGEIWKAGIEIDWDKLYENEERKRISLPTYPFELKKFKSDVKFGDFNSFKHTHISLSQKDICSENVNDWFYVPSWKRRPDNASDGLKSETILILYPENNYSAQLKNTITKYCPNIIFVAFKSGYRKLNEGHFEIDPKSKPDYEKVLKDIKARNVTPSIILHLGNLYSNNEHQISECMFRNSQETGIYSLLFLVQSMENISFEKNINIITFSNGLNKVTGNEKIYPEKATILSLVKIIPQEYGKINCKNIDLEVDNEDLVVSSVEKILITELVCNPNISVAFRGTYAWELQYEKLGKRLNKPKSLTRNGGTYLIVGGTGGIGLELAEYLVKNYRANLILCSRTGFPPRENWDPMLNDTNTDKTFIGKIKRIQALFHYGSDILLEKADVSKKDEMTRVVEKSLKKFDEINGIFHFAGEKDDGKFIHQKTATNLNTVLLPKTIGTIILNEIAATLSPDFVMLSSSLASILPTIGHIDYSAANLFLDSFAGYKENTGSYPVYSINWEIWKSIGMSLRGDPENDKPENNKDYKLSTSDGIEVFKKVFENPLSQLIICKRDLNSLNTQLNELNHINVNNVNVNTLNTVEDNESKINTSDTGFQDKLSILFKEYLGTENIDVNENFFNMGITSLNVVQLCRLFNEKFNISIPAAYMFEHPTIVKLAGFLSDKTESISKSDKELSPSDEGSEDLLFNAIKNLNG